MELELESLIIIFKELELDWKMQWYENNNSFDVWWKDFIVNSIMKWTF